MEKSSEEYELEIRKLKAQIVHRESLDLFNLQKIASLYADDQISGGKFRELAAEWLLNGDVNISYISNDKEYVRSEIYAVDQIYFSNWGNPSAPKNYFSDIDEIAYMIGAMLKDISTISIIQTKEKFGEARVYVDIASFELVNDLWRQHGQKGDPTDDFIESCRISDMKHYRHIYQMIFRLLPQYKKAIASGADYIEWTFSTVEEWDDWCTYREKYNPNVREQYKEVYENLYMPLRNQSKP